MGILAWTTKSAARYPVVSSQLVMTDSVVTRRYRLHRYRGPVVTRRYPYIVTSLHLVVTALYGCRYTSRR